MKKLALIVMALAMMVTLSMSVFAAQDAFAADGLLVFDNDNCYLEDDEDTNADGGGSGQPIQKMEAYGVGYSSLNDKVIFKDVDFGENGADEFSIWFSIGNDNYTTIDVYYINEGKEVAAVKNYQVQGPTGGWEKDFAQEFKADVEIPGGVYDVFVMFADTNSGSFDKIAFHEAPAPEVVEEPVEEVVEVIDVAPAAPVTADAGIVVAAVVMAAAAAVVVSKKH